jgi:hypothetical protein
LVIDSAGGSLGHAAHERVDGGHDFGRVVDGVEVVEYQDEASGRLGQIRQQRACETNAFRATLERFAQRW